jgi:tyrosyl-tRNA synthetase
MANFQSDLLKTLNDRGFVHQCTDGDALDEQVRKGVVSVYNGFDCTGPSLHVGHLLPIMMLRIFQQHGHKPIVLLGGGTTKIGDPSFKDESRPLLADETIDRNIQTIGQTFTKLLSFGEGPSDALLVNNDEWLSKLEYIPLLREIGRHFTINRMLTFDSVKLRLEREQPLTFLEFNYMILQAYDFLELNRRYGCHLQTGGSDQWGNIVNGVELVRRMDATTVYGLTSPLITTSSGAKMGKTVAGAVWLNADMLSPYDYWQYWRNTEDADVGRFLKIFTELPLAEITKLESLDGQEINEAKKILALEATMLIHGRESAEKAAETARQTFEEGVAAAGLPTVEISQTRLADGAMAAKIFAEAGLCPSASAARREIKGGGARVNDAPLADEKALLTLRDVNSDGVIKLSIGKKRHVLINPI